MDYFGFSKGWVKCVSFWYLRFNFKNYTKLFGFFVRVKIPMLLFMAGKRNLKAMKYLPVLKIGFGCLSAKLNTP